MSCRREIRRLWLRLLLGSVLTILTLSVFAQDAAGRRIVAFADVHGAYDELMAMLQQVDILGQDLQWIGGDDYLVSLGDLVDRGADSRKVMDLLMRLQGEAADAGGKVVVVLGNHEAMTVTGELDYVSDGEIAAFAGDESQELRDRWFEAYLDNPGRSVTDESEARAVFDQTFAPGYFARLEAFSPEGSYGSWLLQLPIATTIDGTLFVHGGLAPVMTRLPTDSLNSQLGSQVRSFSEAWYTLIRSGAMPVNVIDERVAIAEAIAADTGIDAHIREAARQLIEADAGIALSADSPFWYRGNVYCYPLVESNTIVAALKMQNAERVVVGHTPTQSRRIETLRDGEIVMLDTGMLGSAYGGSAAALIIEDGRLMAAYPGEDGLSELIASPRQVGARPGNLSDDDLEQFLLTADIIADTPIPQGVTEPHKLTLEKDGVRIQAVFKSLATDARKGQGPDRNRAINNSDRWQYEIAAYRLDRLLGLDMVPVTVERKVNGEDGALIYWLPELISLLEKNQQDISAEGYCPLQPQHDLMYVWDTLIYNEDRTLQNVTYTTNDWMLRLIDQSRSFRTYRDMPPYVRERELIMGRELADRLAALTSEQINEAMGQYLSRDQIRALLRRRDRLIEDWATIVDP